MIWHNDFAVLWEQWYNVMQINLALHTLCPTAADLIKKTFQQAGWVFYLFLEWKNIVFCVLSSTKPRVFTERALWNAPLRLAQTCVCKLYFFLSVKPRPPFFSKNLMVLLVLFLWNRMTVRGGCKEKKWSRNSCELALSIGLLVLRREHWLYQHRYAMSLDLTCVRMV